MSPYFHILSTALMLSIAIPSLAHAQESSAPKTVITDSHTVSKQTVVDSDHLFDQFAADQFSTSYKPAPRRDRSEEEGRQNAEFYAQQCRRQIKELADALFRANYDSRTDYGLALDELTKAVERIKGQLTDDLFAKVALGESLKVKDLVKKELDGFKPKEGEVAPSDYTKTEKTYQYFAAAVDFAFYVYDEVDDQFDNHRANHDYHSQAAQFAREELLSTIRTSTVRTGQGMTGIATSNIALSVISKSAEWSAVALSYSNRGEGYACNIAELLELSRNLHEEAGRSMSRAQRDLNQEYDHMHAVAYSISELSDVCDRGQDFRAFGEGYKDSREESGHHGDKFRQ